jgi:soluble lytic murein transglycosylase
MKLSGTLFASVAFAFSAAQAQPAHSVTADSGSLPPGLIRQGGVVMMQPIADSEEGGPGGAVFGGERRSALFRYLAPSDHALFARAIELADRGNWTEARALAAQARDPVAKRIIEWGYLLDKNSGAPFAEIIQFLKDFPDWPLRETLIVRAETAMPALLDPQSVVTWFGDRQPRTGIGKVRLGEALIATGGTARGQALIREAWIDDNFEPDQEAYVTARFGNLLTPEVERTRVERLLLGNHLGAARQELPRLAADTRRLAQARLDLREHPSFGEREIGDLPPALRDDPGLLFDETQLLRERNQVAAIPALLDRIPAAQFASWNPSRWSSEISQDARAALRLGFDREAYRIAAADALPRDASEYPDAEFLAGWIALRRLGEPRVALLHFQNLAGVATHPVTRSRAHYWAARALEAAGESAAAIQEYRIAAADAPTFFGQLALTRIQASPLLHLETTPVDPDSARALYERDDLVSAIRVAADLGLESPLREFAAKYADLHPDAAHLKLLVEDLSRMGYREVAVRVAKAASYADIRFFEYSHPLIVVPRYVGAGIAPEDALVLAIIRQETEFDPAAVSGAGARGLMQVMPDAAKQTAEKMGLSYRPGDLLADSTYNMELGTAQLAHNLSVWDGSYILAAAAYNAGLGNVHKWVVAFGDPRDPRVDPVDWIEEIPFSETRNYVERVLENVEVYRSRLAGRDVPLQILADLHRPYMPQASVPAYATTAAPATVPFAPRTTATPTTVISAPQSTPVAQPTP